MHMREDRRRQVENESREPLPEPHQGFARWQDVEDFISQSNAPRAHATRWDRSGEQRYDAGLRQFIAAHPHRRRSAWDLDDGRVQFSEPRESFIGRGPRGYRRSDERVHEDVCDALTDARDLDATDIDVTVRDGVVTLSGQVDGRSARRRAEDIAAETSGVLDVMNQLSVRTDDVRRSAG
jgi:hypothetical protein